jgi:hypothetical protein
MFSVPSGPISAHATMDTVTEELCFLYGPCLDVISRTIRGVSSVELGTVESSELLSSQRTVAVRLL